MVAKAPHPLIVLAEQITAELTAYPQFVGWRYEWRQGRWAKVPIDPGTGRQAKSNDPRTWASFESALGRAQRDHLAGIGFVFSTDDPYAGVDLDRCRDPETGELAPWAEEVVVTLDSYSEISPSSTGVKGFVRARIPPGGNRTGQVEVYDHGRYFTVTGHHLPGTRQTIEDRQVVIDILHARLFTRVGSAAPTAIKENPQPLGGAKILADDALLARAMAARNGAHFARLWRGDIDGYPSSSEADLALCALLAYWCGPDPERIDRLFRQSGLFQPTWDAPHYADGRTYGVATIRVAMTDQHRWAPAAPQLSSQRGFLHAWHARFRRQLRVVL
jgi:putative DNA primase/helicase